MNPTVKLDARFFSEILLMPDGTSREIVPLERAERWFNDAQYAGTCRAALLGLLNHYVALINSGDAGNWDPETEDVVIHMTRY
jgi:hypothetical protein